MSGDFEEWSNEPARDFRAEQDHKETERGRRIQKAAGLLFWLAAAAALIILHFLGVY